MTIVTSDIGRAVSFSTDGVVTGYGTVYEVDGSAVSVTLTNNYKDSKIGWILVLDSGDITAFI